MTEALLPRYAAAQTIFFTDERIKPRYVEYGSHTGQVYWRRRRCFTGVSMGRPA